MLSLLERGKRSIRRLTLTRFPLVTDLSLITRER